MAKLAEKKQRLKEENVLLKKEQQKYQKGTSII